MSSILDRFEGSLMLSSYIVVDQIIMSRRILVAILPGFYYFD